MRARTIVIALTVVVHIALVGYSAAVHFPPIDEIGHLPAGVSHLRFGEFSLYRGNPPLVRIIGALPVLASGVEVDWRHHHGTLRARREFQIGHRFITDYGCEAVKYFTLARWACIPFTILGAWAVYSLAREMYGGTAPLAALFMWCFSPTVIAYASTIMPDLGAAACGAAAIVYFRRWLIKAMWRYALVTGILLGVAALTKTTWLILFGVLPSLWLLYGVACRPVGRGTRRIFGRSGVQLVVLLTVGILTMNVGYGFEGSFQRLDEFTFLSKALRGSERFGPVRDERETRFGTGNRFRGTLLGNMRVPIPANYLQGMDLVKAEFEQGYASYLGGDWRHGGWWYYYLYAMVIKIPLGFLLVGFLSGGVFLLQCTRRGLRRTELADELNVVVPLVLVICVVSAHTGFTHHIRYVLPAFPFLFVWISRVFAHTRRNAWWSVLCGSLLAWGAVSSCSVFPHWHSYYNELVGGPAGGWKHLNKSNTDWGEDLTFLRKWLADRPGIGRVGVADNSPVNLSALGLNTYEPNTWPLSFPSGRNSSSAEGPQPGWFAVSVCKLGGEPAQSYWGRPSQAYTSDPSRSYFRFFQPIGRIGYSMNIYYVTLEDCNRVRRKLGIEELSPESERKTQRSETTRDRSRSQED